jgi:hypothetical protein
MGEPKGAVERSGIYVAVGGVALLAGIFLVVFVNGSWPETLSPVRALFQFLGDTIGDWAVIAEVGIFAAPGLVIYGVGRLLNQVKPGQSG